MLKANFKTILIAAAALGLLIFWSTKGRQSQPAESSEMTTIEPQQAQSSPLAQAESAVPPMTVPAITEKPGATKNERVQKFVEQAQAKLPRLRDLQQLSAREVHRTPEAILVFSESLASLVENTKAHPEDLPAALEFYDRCASDSEVAISVRAQCYHQAILAGIVLRQEQEILRWNVPPEVRTVATRLIDSEIRKEAP